MNGASTKTARVDALAAKALAERTHHVHRVMLAVLLGEWVVTLVLALVLAPRGWAGRTSSAADVTLALVGGPALNALPIFLARRRPNAPLTRHVVALAQMGWTAALVQLTGGHLESHLHVFGSLAFLALYADWRVLATATVAFAAGPLVSRTLLPGSIDGHPVDGWRVVEYAAWVGFEVVVLLVHCRRSVREMRRTAEREAELEETHAATERALRIHSSEITAAVRRFRQLAEGTHAIPWEVSLADDYVVYLAPYAEEFFGFPQDALMEGKLLDVVHPDDRTRFRSAIATHTRGGEDAEFQVNCRVVRGDGRVMHVTTFFSYLAAEPTTLRGLTIDVSKEVELAQELRQAQKLEAVGRLASGVAHEINTPVQFVSDSVHFVRDGLAEIAPVVRELSVVASEAADGTLVPGRAAAVLERTRELDLDYVLDHVPDALRTALDGLERVATIVRSMKAFAHPEQNEMVHASLNEAIRTTLTIATNEYRYVADVDLALDDVPPVLCRPGEINQVLLNLVVNAAHAIRDVVGNTGARGKITVRSRVDADGVTISIGDTGTGIPEAVRSKIFDPFFTTKTVGQGTGQGLAIARSIVVDKHHGMLRFETETGRGTTFFLTLPLRSAGVMAEAA